MTLNAIKQRLNFGKFQWLEWFATLWLAFFIFIPAVCAFFLSFMTKPRHAPARLPFTFEHYRALFTLEYNYCLFYSFFLAASAVLVCSIISYLFLFFLRKKQNSPQYFSILAISCLPFTANSLFRIYGLKQTLTGLNFFQNNLLPGPFRPIFHIRWLHSPFAVILGLVSLLFPFVFLPLWLASRKIETSHLEAARDLGACDHQIFWNIIYPLTAQARVTGFTMAILPAVGMFYVSDFLGGAHYVLWGNVLRGQLFMMKNSALASATCCLLFFYLICAAGMWMLFTRVVKKLAHYFFNQRV